MRHSVLKISSGELKSSINQPTLIEPLNFIVLRPNKIKKPNFIVLHVKTIIDKNKWELPFVNPLFKEQLTLVSWRGNNQPNVPLN